MAMIFTLVSAAQEKLNEFVDKLKNRKEEEQLRKEREAEEAEKNKFTGTPVTLETFLAWRRAFEQETLQSGKNKEQNFKGKLTGKEANCVFSHDVMAAIFVSQNNETAAIFVSQNNETAAMFVSQTSPVGVELFSYVNAFFCSKKFA